MPPRISIVETRHGDQHWHCPNCGADGTAIELVMTVQGIGRRAALKALAARLDPDTSTPKPPNRRGQRSIDSLEHPTASDIDAWVDRASKRLWEPYGDQTRHWLTKDRRLPDDVLTLHRIGATGITLTDEVSQRPKPAAVAVLPVVSARKAVYAKLRLIEPPADRGPYLSPLSASGSPPAIGLFRPPRRQHSEILVTSSILDALAANAAGYRAASLMAPDMRNAQATVHLARLQGPLVIALSPDMAGDQTSDAIARHLWARGRRPALLAEMDRDLSDSLAATNNWSRKLQLHVRHAVISGPLDPVPER